MKSPIVYAASLLIAGLISVQAAPVTKSTAQAEKCLAEFGPKLGALSVPEDVQKFVDSYKMLNSQLNLKSLTKMVVSEQAEKDVYRVGLVNEKTSNALAPSCAKYVAEVMNSMKAPDCKDVAELDEKDFSSYIDLISQDPKLDAIVGAAQACLFV